MAEPSLPRFLVGDYNQANRDVLSWRLVRLGHTSIDHAEDGRAAVDMVRAAKESYDVILSRS